MDQVVDKFRELLRQRAAVARLQLLLKRRFDESQVNRHPAGVSEGGRFAPAGGGGTSAAKPSASSVAPGTASEGFKNHVRASMSNLAGGSNMALLAKTGLTWRAERMMSDHPNLKAEKGKTPPGYPPGTTIDSAPGVYLNQYKQIVVTEYSKSGNETIQHSKDFIEGTVYHEVGHAFDDAAGALLFPGKKQTVSQTKFVLDAYKKDVAKLSGGDKKTLAYFMQPNGRGASEAFAEIFAQTQGGKGNFVYDILPHFPNLTEFVTGTTQAVLEELNKPPPKKPEPKKPPAKKPKKAESDEVVF